MSSPTLATAIIPARMGSTRFPAKAIAAETGTPLVVHVCQAAARASRVGRVAVATDHETIAEAVRAAGFEAVMTSPDHDSGTSRVAEAARVILGETASPESVIVNVQGDEPEIEPEVIDAAVGVVASGAGSPAFAIGTVASPFDDPAEADRSSVVKAVLALPDAGGRAAALYFSRARVPSHTGEDGAAPLRHVGIYAFTAAALARVAQLAPTPLERAERLEQLRWLEHGERIGIAVRQSAHAGIDTPEDYAAFVRRWRAVNG